LRFSGETQAADWAGVWVFGNVSDRVALVPSYSLVEYTPSLCSVVLFPLIVVPHPRVPDRWVSSGGNGSVRVVFGALGSGVQADGLKQCIARNYQCMHGSFGVAFGCGVVG
jgi:hypothetical protein